jgi:hypothetical protein
MAASLALASLAFAVLAPRAARADDWRFCLATVRAQHKVFLSRTFATSAEMETLQSDFANELDRRGLPHDEVQCPRGTDRDSATEMQLNAIGFNREMGNTVVRVEWRPVR